MMSSCLTTPGKSRPFLCLSRTTLLEEADIDFFALAFYVEDGIFYWGLETEAIQSRVWQDLIDVDDDYLYHYGTSESKL